MTSHYGDCADDLAHLSDSITLVRNQIKMCIDERGLDIDPDDVIARELNLADELLAQAAELLDVTNHFYFNVRRPDIP